jgi:hypothetical protein
MIEQTAGAELFEIPHDQGVKHPISKRPGAANEEALIVTSDASMPEIGADVDGLYS